MANILIAGCGYVGCALAERLSAVGHEVWGLRRDPAELPACVKAIGADLTRRDGLAATLPDTVDTVFFLAAADRTSEEAYRAIYVDGLANLIAAIDSLGLSPQRMFVTTSTAVYGQHQGEWIDEASPTRPARFTGKRLLESEAVAAQAPFASTVVRFGGIYGPGRTRIIERVSSGAARLYRERHYTNRIHRDDCAAVLHHLMDLDEPKDLYLGVDCDPADLSDVVAWIADKIGTARPEQVETPREIAGSKRCRNARLLASGYRFRYPSFREGYQSIIGIMAAGDAS